MGNVSKKDMQALGQAQAAKAAQNQAAQSAAAQKRAADKAQATTLKNQGLREIGGGTNRYGQERPGQLSIMSEEGGLAPQFQQTMGESLSQLKDIAMTEGDTEAARMARERQGLMSQEARDDLRAQQASGVAQGMRNLAMRGGASTGARERLMSGATSAGLRGMQDLGRENRLAQLQISQQDAARKEGLLGNLGKAEQLIQEGNIGRLAGDVQSQNLARQKFYEEDMRAYGAQQSAKAQKSAAKSSCFTAESMIKMADGRYKQISEIGLNENVFEGGPVYSCLKSISEDVYNYKGTKVAGTHAVLEDGKWIRIKDTKEAVKMDGLFVVYNLSVPNHMLVVNDIIFADYDETDLGCTISDEESLRIMNG